MISVHISLYTVLAKLTQKTYMLLHLHQPQYFFSIHINIIFLSPTPTQFLAKKKLVNVLHQPTQTTKPPQTTPKSHLPPKQTIMNQNLSNHLQWKFSSRLSLNQNSI